MKVRKKKSRERQRSCMKISPGEKAKITNGHWLVSTHTHSKKYEHVANLVGGRIHNS